MPFPIEDKFVVGISSNALFDLYEEDQIFLKEGLENYKKYQIDNRKTVLEKGVAYPFIRRFLSLNALFPQQQPVEVVVLSKNSPETGLRIFNSIKEYGLNITRGAFTSGRSPYEYIPAYNLSLFLSTDETDVKNAISRNYPAGRILLSDVHDIENDSELRLAFDFDGVLADDSAERVFQVSGNIKEYHKHEQEWARKPLEAGPLKEFLKKVSTLQRLENDKLKTNPEYNKVIRTAVITARNAPAHERAINTLASWDIDVDEMFFMGGIEKKRILQILKPHLFLDDQVSHLDSSLHDVALVHIPFGSLNNVLDNAKEH